MKFPTPKAHVIAAYASGAPLLASAHKAIKDKSSPSCGLPCAMQVQDHRTDAAKRAGRKDRRTRRVLLCGDILNVSSRIK